jgi:hypothetical protein
MQRARYAELIIVTRKEKRRRTSEDGTPGIDHKPRPTMRSRFTFATLSTFAASVALLACASSNAHESRDASLSEERYMQIEAGKSIELSLDVPNSDAPIDPIIVTFAASAPIAWNVMHRPYGDMEVVVEGLASAQVIRHTPSEPGPFALLWENQSDAPVRATVRVKGLPAGTKGVWNAPT